MKITNTGLLLCLFCSYWSVTPCIAEVHVPKLISDGLILQRDSKVKLWGSADEGEAVIAQLNGETLGETLATQGKWEISFDAPSAGGPHHIEIKGKNNSIPVKDVYFGDVWLASGQSNMQTTMARVAEMFSDELENANYPLIRQFTVPRVMRFDKPVEDYSGGSWEPSTPSFLPNHSAVAYFFAKSLYQKQKVAIGILSANYGGSPAESWINEEQLKSYPKQYKHAKSLQDADYLQGLKDADKKDSEQWHHKLNSSDKGLNEAWHNDSVDHSKWPTVNIPSRLQEQGIEPMSGIVWLKKTIHLPEHAASRTGMLRLGTLVDADTAYINGTEVGKTTYQYPPRRYKLEPGVLRAGENTITVRLQINNKAGEFIPEKPYYLAVGETKIDLKGPWHYNIGAVVEPPPPLRYIPWSQPLGCFNGMLAPLVNMNIKGALWYQGESNAANPEEYRKLLPQLIAHWRALWQKDFPFLFVQLPNYGSKTGYNSGWPEFRQVQLDTYRQVPNTAMAISIDVGEWNDLHPLDKKSVGERLALAARSMVYGEKDLVYSGPLYKSLSRKNKKLQIDFDFVGDGLKVQGKTLQGFEVAGEDGKYLPASAKINKQQVLIWNKKIKKPVKARYAWRDSPSSANLYNKNGLPASPFEASL